MNANDLFLGKFRYWMKTTNNCYVAEKSLYSKPDITYLDPCGPIPLMDPVDHQGNGTVLDEVATASPINRHSHHRRAPTPRPESLPSTFGTSYLINVTVGEDHAYCRSCPDEKCRVEKSYRFNQEVWLQCLAENNGTWWSETTDFCYVKNSDFWESPEGDCESNLSDSWACEGSVHILILIAVYKNPLCSSFGTLPDNGKAKLV